MNASPQRAKKQSKFKAVEISHSVQNSFILLTNITPIFRRNDFGVTFDPSRLTPLQTHVLDKSTMVSDLSRRQDRLHSSRKYLSELEMGLHQKLTPTAFSTAGLPAQHAEDLADQRALDAEVRLSSHNNPVLENESESESESDAVAFIPSSRRQFVKSTEEEKREAEMERLRLEQEDEKRIHDSSAEVLRGLQLLELQAAHEEKDALLDDADLIEMEMVDVALWCKRECQRLLDECQRRMTALGLDPGQ